MRAVYNKSSQAAGNAQQETPRGRRPPTYLRSAIEAGPGPGVIKVGHWCEPNGTTGGSNGVMPRLALSAMMAARDSCRSRIARCRLARANGEAIIDCKRRALFYCS